MKDPQSGKIEARAKVYQELYFCGPPVTLRGATCTESNLSKGGIVRHVLIGAISLENLRGCDLCRKREGKKGEKISAQINIK